MPDPGIIALLPCHSLEDLPTHHTGDQANALLATLTTAWHPRLIHAVGSPTQWRRIDSPPEDCHRLALIVPGFCRQRLPTGFPNRVAEQGGLLVTEVVDRQQVAQTLSDWFEIADAAAGGARDRAADFFALGYAYWQIQIMTRQLRYSSHLDMVQFEQTVRSAAAEYIAGDDSQCRSHLQSAFDLLFQERNRYFPVDPLLLDLTLVAETTLGNALANSLQQTHLRNYLIRGADAESLIRQNPETAGEMKRQIADGQIAVVGGAHEELPWSLMSIESVLLELQRAKTTYRETIGEPKMFARRRYGWTSSLPQLLSSQKFSGAVFANFDEGQFPRVANNPVNWKSSGTSLYAVALEPVDAQIPDPFMKLGLKMGESIDSAHSAALLLTHWPDQVCQWFRDLVRIQAYGNVLGEFVTLTQYQERQTPSGMELKTGDEEFRSEWLKQNQIRGTADLVSTVVSYWQQRSLAVDVQQLEIACQLVGGSSAANTRATWELCRQTLNDCDRQMQRLIGNSPTNSAETFPDQDLDSLHKQKDANRFEIVQRIVDKQQSSNERSVVIVNTLAQPRRVVCEVSGGEWSAGGAVFAADVKSNGGGHLAVDVPSLGYAVVKETRGARRARRSQNIVDGETLRNEFFEMKVDPLTGGLRGLHCYRRRGNLFSQQLALRNSSPALSQKHQGDRLYSVAKLETIRTLINNSVLGVVETTGTMLVEGETVAKFRQRISVARGKRIAEFDVEIEPIREVVNDPWRSYYASRFAWTDESAKLHGSINETRTALARSRIESPRFIEIADSHSRITILTAGIPFHRFYDHRRLDSLLIVHGETRRKFRFGVGLNVEYPLRAASDFETPPLVWEGSHPLRLPQSSAWLLRCDCKNIVVTAIEPLFAKSDQPVGLRLRFRETEGRSGRATIDCARPIKLARRCDPGGESLQTLAVTDQGVAFDFSGHDYGQIELLWTETATR